MVLTHSSDAQNAHAPAWLGSKLPGPNIKLYAQLLRPREMLHRLVCLTAAQVCGVTVRWLWQSW